MNQNKLPRMSFATLHGNPILHCMQLCLCCLSEAIFATIDVSIVRLSSFLSMARHWQISRVFAILSLIAVCGCASVTREFGEWPREIDGLAPIPRFASAIADSVVLPTQPVLLAFSWESKETGRVDYHAYYGWSEDGITNLFGVTDNWSITNSVIWPEWAEYIYGNVVAQNSNGRSEPSHVDRLPPFLPNAVELSATPSINGQVLVCESPDREHWVCYYTRLPVTNAVTDAATTFYRVIPSNGFPTNSAGTLVTSGLSPITLNIEPRREWNAEKKHYGQ